MAEAPARPGQDRLTGSVLGGLLASEALRPYMVGLFTPFDAFCSAVLISRRWVLSAAHCRPLEGTRVVIGDAVAVESNAVTTVRRVFTSPDFDRSKRIDLFDLAVVELEDEAPPFAKFMKVNSRVLLPEDNSVVRMVGYGRTSESDESRLALRQVDVSVITPAMCEEFYRELVRPVSIRKKVQICIRSQREGCGSWYAPIDSFSALDN